MFIRQLNMGKTPTIIMESIRKTIKAFPKSNYTKETETHRFYISAKYIKNITVIK